MKKINIISNNKIRKLSIGTAEGFLLIDLDSILYLQSDNSYTMFYLADNKKIIATKSLGYYEEKLKGEAFIRIHNSYIVNVCKVIRYTKGDGGCVFVDAHKSLPVSRNRKKKFIEVCNSLC